jgi:hypothetical protein
MRKYLRIAFRGFQLFQSRRWAAKWWILHGGNVSFGEGLLPTWVLCIVVKRKIVRIRQVLCYWNIFGAR